MERSKEAQGYLKLDKDSVKWRQMHIKLAKGQWKQAVAYQELLEVQPSLY